MKKKGRRRGCDGCRSGEREYRAGKRGEGGAGRKYDGDHDDDDDDDGSGGDDVKIKKN